MKAGFVTFGCRLNKAEALEMEAEYAAAGWDVVSVKAGASRDEPPDVIVVRGCSVTAKAQHDCEKEIAHLRARFPQAEIRIAGCLPGAPPPVRNRMNTASAATVNIRTSRAYLKVQDGCSGKCAYCIVPSFRGAPMSVPFGDALSRARAFLAAGFREIVVTGCNLCLYHDGGRGLPELVAALASLESPGHRIRLGSIEPGICDDALLDVMEDNRNVCRFIHLSLQSGSDRILALRRRPNTAERVASLCDEARRRLGPRLALGADVIAGFPGETETDHEATKAFIASRFIHLHAFATPNVRGHRSGNVAVHTSSRPPRAFQGDGEDRGGEPRNLRLHAERKGRGGVRGERRQRPHGLQYALHSRGQRATPFARPRDGGKIFSQKRRDFCYNTRHKQKGGTLT